MNLKSFLYRAYLKANHGRDSWHRRFYRPSVRIVRAANKVWFVEGDKRLEAATLVSMVGTFGGRVNVLLSGPSVRQIKALGRVHEHRLVCVNGSPAILDDDSSRFFMYHVNDTGYIRNNPEAFRKNAARAEWTLIDYRAIFLMLRLGIESIPETKFVVFDNWAWPLANAVHEIPELADQPRKGEAFLSKDPSLGLANAGTVAYTAAQALWHWGFERVYFYGLDLNAKGRAYNEASPQPQRLDKVFECIIEPAFDLLRENTADGSCRFFNCSPDSRLSDAVMSKLEPDASFDG
jgi:hypothetical protein